MLKQLIVSTLKRADLI